MNTDYDILIVGAGFFGAVVAEQIASTGRSVLLIDKRDHLGGNAHSVVDSETGIEYCPYGSHIFHTSNIDVWNYVNSFCVFNDYRHTVWSTYENKVYSLPINLNTINRFYNLNIKPEEVDDFIKKETEKFVKDNPANFEELSLSQVGETFYNAFIKYIIKKNWGDVPDDFTDDFLISLKINKNYNMNFFEDTFQGIPVCGYKTLFHKIVANKNIDIRLSINYEDIKEDLGEIPTLYTGSIDSLFNYELGRLEWRTLDFEIERYDYPEFQGCAIMNFSDMSVPYVRIHEPRYFHEERDYDNKTIIIKEFSREAGEDDDPFYPVETERNYDLYNQYVDKLENTKNILVGGRLGSYSCMSMGQTIEAALKMAEEILGDM